MKEYKIPSGTLVEIVNPSSRYYGKRGTLGASDPSGLAAHNVWFRENENDFDCFIDDEILPVQNIIKLNNLDYETLVEVFNHEHIYDTDRVIVYQKKFTEEELNDALKVHSNLYADYLNDKLESIKGGTEKRGQVIDLLCNMLGDNYDDSDFATAIQETLMFEQWWVEGLRKHYFWNGKGKKPRYFNGDAKIDVIYID